MKETIFRSESIKNATHFIIEKIKPFSGIYLSINPLAFTQPDGTIIKRRLEITWYGKQVVVPKQR